MTQHNRLTHNPNVAMPELCGILLAAGQSVRFGNNKLLQPLANGIPLITQAVRNMQAALDKVVVVVPPQQTALASILEKENVVLTINTAASDGMGTSLACGVAACLEADGWIIGLADMPWIQPSTIIRLAMAMQEGRPLVTPRYQNQRGHPVGFEHRFASELVKLQGDHGARSILKQYQTQLHYIDVNDPGILLDVDTPADLTHSSIPT